MTDIVGILHPGEMGSSLANTVRNSVGKLYWCSQGRSQATRARAEQQQLTEITSLRDFCKTCTLIIGVCPPHAARAQARALIDAGYHGLYLEANAISPATVQQLALELATAGITLIDGGIVGLPTMQRGTTWLYLSGPQAQQVQPCFSVGPIETVVLGEAIGQASALKMLFAAWNKGKNALLGAILATAEQTGVRTALEQQFDQFEPGFSTNAHQRLRGIARKAWRFPAEMQEIAGTLQANGVPAAFFTAAAEVYQRQAVCKDAGTPPSLETLLHLIANQPD